MSRRRLLAGLAGAAGLVALLTVVSRILGFGRWLVQAAAVGAEGTGDAYVTANALPNILYEVVAGGALAGVIIPVLAAPLARRLSDQVDHIASALLTWTVLVLTPVALLLAVLARPIAGLLPSPGDADGAAQTDLVAYFLIVFSPQVLLYGIGIVLTGILQAQKRFLAPALAPIYSTLVVIVSYLAFAALADGLAASPGELSDLALGVLAWGTTAGVAVLSLPLLIPVRRSGVRLRPRLRFPDGVARRVRSLALAGLGGVLAQQLATLVVMLLARSRGVDGTLAVFSYTQAVYLLPFAVMAVPLVTVFQPRVAELAGEGVGPTLARLATTSTRTVIAAGMAGVGILFAAAPAVEVVFERWTDVPGMAAGLTWMAPGVVGLGVLLHAGRMLLALDRSRASVTATALAWATVAVTAAIAVTVMAPQGQDGVATLRGIGLGHSVGMSVGAVVILAVLWQIVPDGFAPRVLRTLAVGAASAGIGGLLGRIAANAIIDLGGRSVLMASMAGALGVLTVVVVWLIATSIFDRAILSLVRSRRA